MAGNVLEELVAGWYDYKGYFVRKNIRIAKIERGGRGELLNMGAAVMNRLELTTVRVVR